MNTEEIDKTIRQFLKVSKIFTKVESKIKEARKEMIVVKCNYGTSRVKNACPIVYEKCPECGNNKMAICQDTKGIYRYCVCPNVKLKKCSVYILL